MSDHTPVEEAKALLSPKRLAVQVVGFIVGLGLLAWIIVRAIEGGDWTKLRDADPWLVAALLGSTVLSSFLNASAFWVTIRPIKPIPFWDLQRVNVLANMLNYAPVRIGAIGRVLYHMKIDGLTFLQIAAWFFVIGLIMVIGVSAAAFATVLRYDHAGLLTDPVWWLLLLGTMAVGLLAMRVLGGFSMVERYGQGYDRIVGNRPALLGAAGLRLADLTCFAARMGAAAAILDIRLSVAQLILLALVALVTSLVPVGRFGFREAGVAFVGHRLSMAAEDVTASMDQLALVESAGEVLVFLPLGLLLLPWLRTKWRSSNG